MIRIISGKYKGRRIKAPKKLPVRPTTDMAKEALFNILRNTYYFTNLQVLDLFAGTGNISFEFASRGTVDITAVDSHFACVQFISKIAKEFEFNITTIKSDVFKVLERLSRSYDVIFADPPYDLAQSEFVKISERVFDNKLLNPEGLLIIEHSKHTVLNDAPYYQETRKYGGSAFSFFKATMVE